MELNEIDAVLEKIWDLHDKLSDAIHSISRAHFLNSVKKPTGKSGEFYVNRKKKFAGDDDDLVQKEGLGFVFVKEFRPDEEDMSVHEAKSLYAIRTALENLEDQLEFFHVSDFDFVMFDFGVELVFSMSVNWLSEYLEICLFGNYLDWCLFYW